jgi:nicotinamide-nucleotide amidase
MKQAWIISVGAELTLGRKADTNAPWLARELAAPGVVPQRCVTVGDELAALRDVLIQAGAAADFVLVTGGLGPTEDDLTRAALAAAMGSPLELHKPSLERIRAFFTSRGREMHDRNRVQAMLPRGAEAIDNPRGTAPGIAAPLGRAVVFVTPGVPFEMRAMFERDVAPRLRAATGGGVIVSGVLNCFGLGESDLGARIADMMQRDRNPQVGTNAHLGVISVRVDAAGESEAQARERLDADLAEVRRRLGTVVFGEDDRTLAGATGSLLGERGQTLCVAESCTGGLIAKFMTDVPGSSDYFSGGAVTYSNELKTRVLGVDAALIDEHGAVSEAVAGAMAGGALAAFGCDWAIAVTGIAGPSGGSADKPIGLVHAALAGPCSDEAAPAAPSIIHRRWLFGGEAPREVIRERAALAAIDLLRRRLLGAV